MLCRLVGILLAAVVLAFAVAGPSEAARYAARHHRRVLRGGPEVVYVPQARFRSPCIQRWNASILTCLPAPTAYAGPADAVEVINEVSTYNSRQHRPYLSLSPWDR